MAVKLFFIVFVLPLYCFSQYTTNQIDTLLLNPFRYNKNMSKDEIILWNKSLIDKSLKLNYLKGEILGYRNIATVLGERGKYQEGLKCLSIAEKKAKELDDNYIYGQVYTEYSKLYNMIGLSEYAVKYGEQAVNYATKATGVSERDYKLLLSRIYGNNGICYVKNDKKKALQNLYKSYTLRKGLEATMNLATYYNEIEYNPDSVEVYVNNAISILKTPKYENNYYVWGHVYFIRAESLAKQKKYEEAIDNFKIALEYAKKEKLPKNELVAYQKMISIYKKTGDSDQELIATREYNKIKEFLDKQGKDVITISIENILEEKETEKKSMYKKIYYIIGICVLLLFIARIIIRKYQKKIILKEKFLSGKETENRELIKRVNEEFDNIIALAKNNHPNFYTRFQEYYPSFQSKLLERNPDLQISELSLLAYIYLNFQTKEIADYTFKSPKTVQNRKHLLRKKLNIPSHEDFYVWLKNIFS